LLVLVKIEESLTHQSAHAQSMADFTSAKS